MELNKEESQYDIDALKGNIEKIKKNIEIFEQAIEKERQQMQRLEKILAVLENDKQRIK